MYRDFTIEHPRSLDEALEILAGDDPLIRPIAGGTGLTPLMKYDFFRPARLVNLGHLTSDLSGIERTAEGGFRLGALTSLRDLELSRDLAASVPVLTQALTRLATVQVRNMARLGGAVAHGHPQMDLPPVLMALGATVFARSHHGERQLPADDLFRGYYETAIGHDEIVTEVRLPPSGKRRGVYRKVTERSVEDWPILGVAVVARADFDRVKEARIVVGGIGDRPWRLDQAESALIGSELTPQLLEAVARDAAGALEYQERPSGSPAYQEQLVATHLRRAFDSLFFGAGE